MKTRVFQRRIKILSRIKICINIKTENCDETEPVCPGVVLKACASDLAVGADTHLLIGRRLITKPYENKKITGKTR